METENVAENETPEFVTVETRFGDIEFSWDKGIYMPVGLLGFPEHHVFGLANIPNSSLDQFKLYQSLTDANLSFIVAPYNTESDVYEEKDLMIAQKSLAIDPADMAILMVVTIRSASDGQGIKLSTNVRAPVFVDTSRQVAWQHVMRNDRYPVQMDL
ncbi:flagellar assembly protein FliW [Thalassospira lucentensis]|uniref:flagellar assembly protein FliW n=1 Tax=Thalassospira lucentensis TaxID=168935 RepID=UPI003AA8AFF8